MGERAQPVEQPPAAPPPPIPAQRIHPDPINQEPFGIRHPDGHPKDLVRHVASLPRGAHPLANLAIFGIL
jgi:hypothetical protein